jgi:hypothetical protein
VAIHNERVDQLQPPKLLAQFVQACVGPTVPIQDPTCREVGSDGDRLATLQPPTKTSAWRGGLEDVRRINVQPQPFGPAHCSNLWDVVKRARCGTPKRSDTRHWLETITEAVRSDCSGQSLGRQRPIVAGRRGDLTEVPDPQHHARLLDNGVGLVRAVHRHPIPSGR